MHPGARFCPACGEPTRAVRAAEEARRHVEVLSSQAAVTTVALGFTISLAIAALAGVLAPVDGPGVVVTQIAFAGSMIALAVVLARRMGPGSREECFPVPTERRFLAYAPVVGLAVLLVSHAYVTALRAALAGGDAAAPGETPGTGVWEFVLVALLAPLAEEALDRGVMWAALRRIAPRGTVLVLTAALFALQHGLNGGWLLELPHRFAGGLLLGALRDRSGSVTPGIVAHVTWNAGALLLPGG